MHSMSNTLTHKEAADGRGAADVSILAAEQLCKIYRDTVAVDGISFHVGRNEVVGLLGPSSVTIRVDGIDIARRRSQALQHTNFAAVYAPLPGNLTVYQNLRIFGLIYGVTDLQQRIETLLAQFDLVHFRNTKCGLLSSGEQTRVGLAKAMINRPRLLLLDEPTASLD